MNREDMYNSIVKLSKEMTPVVESLLNNRTFGCPTDFKKELAMQLYNEMINPKYEFYSQWEQQYKDQIRDALLNALDTLSLQGLYKFCVEFTKDRYKVFAQSIDRSSLEYSSKQNVKNKKAALLDDLLNNHAINKMNILSEFNEENQIQQDPLYKVTNNNVNLISAVKLFLEADEMKENNKLEGITGELNYLLSACLVLDALDLFIKSDSNKYDVIKKTKAFNIALSKLNNNPKYDAIYFEKIYKEKILTIEKIYLANEKVKSMAYSDFYQKVVDVLKSDILPPSLMNTAAISKISSYWENRRVDSMKEAINLYFSEVNQEEAIKKNEEEYRNRINQITSKVNDYVKNVEERVESINAQQKEFYVKHAQMLKEKEELLQKHNNLVDEHNELVDEHNKLVDEINDR